MTMHAWWMAQCRGCKEWMYLGYAGPLEANQIGNFAEPFPIEAKCEGCGHADVYAGRDLHQRFGPDPDAQKPEQ